jgi:hypothetical protein
VGGRFVAGAGRGAATGAVRTRLAIAVLLAVLAAGCSDAKPEVAPDTTVVQETTITTAAAPSTTRRPTTTSSTLKPTTTSSTVLGFGPGQASIVGRVSGPAGPVDGAVVRIERVVGRNVVTADITTAGGGAYELGLILGGSYRVRAFRPPEFGTSPVEAFFLAANERKTLDLRLPPAGGERLTATVTPSPPRIDQQATLKIQYGMGMVDAQGRPSVTPIPNVLLTLTPGAGILVESSPQVRTDATGTGVWFIRCIAEGASALQLAVGTGVTAVNLPPCGAAAPPPPAATSTTRRP